MGLNFNTNFLHTTNQLMIWISLSIFFYYGNSNLNWYDIYSRVLGSEFYLNLYYFLWTSFWYIPFFIFLIVMWQLISYIDYQHVIYIHVLLVLLFLVLVDIHFYWILNTNMYDVHLKSEHFNNLLLNSINKYHPGLLYWSTLVIIRYWTSFNLYYMHSLRKFYVVTFNMSTTERFTTSGVILLITLGFGGWWALQEGSWGGWWNWDPSEVFGLLILVFFLSYMHRPNLKQGYLQVWYWDLSFCIFLLQIYFFTQLNFDLVSHNFGTKIDNFIDNTNFYTWIILISYLFLIRVWLTKLIILGWLSFTSTPYKFLNMQGFKLYGYLILFIFLYESVYSLIPLFNDFLWKLMNINISNHILIFEKYNLQLVYLIILYFWQPNKLLLLFIGYNVWSYYIPWLLYLRISPRITHLFHLFIAAFMWASLLTFSYSYTDWSFYNSIVNSPLSQTILSTNNFAVDYSQVYYGSESFISSWNTVWLDTTPEVYSFVYNLTQQISNQVMGIGVKLFTFNVGVNDILAVNFVYVYTLLLSAYLYRFYSTLRIIF